MLIRVKERGFGIKKIERTRERERKLNEKEEKRRETKLGKLLA